MSSSPKIDLEIITFRDAFLSFKKHLSEEYNKAAAVIYLCEENMKKLNVVAGKTVALKNEQGEIKAEVRMDKSCPDGVGLMPASTIINRIITINENFQSLKRLKVTAYT